MPSNAKSFSKQINSQMRQGRGVVVDGYSMPPEHRAINDFLRRGAAANTWETDPAGRVTHCEGEPVEGEAQG